MPDLIPPVPASAEVPRPLELIYLPRRNPRYWLHGLLFVATVFTMLAAGAGMEFNFDHNQPAFASFLPLTWTFEHPSRLLLGIPFAFTLMAILLAHELGHYLCCRYYGVDATLPFFIPAPTLFGTLGAFIRIRSPIRSRTALFDIGIAGPIAGFVLATAVLFLALPLSKVLPPGPADFDIELRYPLIFRLVWYALPLTELKAHAHTFDAIYFHPTAIAAWVGMLATALNLLPGGQLDGGHIVFSIAPRAHRLISHLTILVLVPMAFYFWMVWLLWAVLLRISGMRHPVVAERPQVRGARLWLALCAFLMLVVTFTPAPIAHFSLVEVVHQIRSGQ